MRSIDPKPYWQIMSALVPGARSAAIFDATGEPVGCSDGSRIEVMSPVAAAALVQARQPNRFDRPGVLQQAGTGLCYALLIRDEIGRALGVAVISCQPPEDITVQPLPVRQVARLLTPVLALLARELQAAGAGEPGCRTIIAETMQLQRLLDATHGAIDDSRQTNALEPLLASLVSRLDCEFALLCAPAQGIESVAFAGEAPDFDTQLALRLARNQLMRLAARSRGGIILNRVRESAQAEVAPLRIVCVSLRRGRATIGILACFSRLQREPFTKAHARELEDLRARFLELIGTSYDEPTGLLTRQAYEEQALERVRRAPDLPRCVVYGDVDRMHIINDSIGFPAGDEVITRLAAMWQNGRPTADSLVGRLSGDRFVALLEDCTLDAARAWAERLRKAVETMRLPPRCAAVRPSLSLGIAACTGGDRFGHVLASAEMACRAAKDRGRNRVEVFAEADVSLMQRHDDLRIFRDLLGALDRGRFRLFAQPIVPLDGRPHPPQYELLVRMLDEDDQIVVPGRFLSAAARYQLLGRLDQWVLDEALKLLSARREQIERSPAVFWINLSGPSVGNREFTGNACARIRATRLPPGTIGIEITESTAVGELEAAREFIKALFEAGSQVALDDFGTGLSSLSYLRELPVAKLKIDGGFVRDLLRDPRAESMVRAMLQIARQLRMETVAECIETAEVATRLKTLGVNFGQGYYYSEPVPLERVLDAGSRMQELAVPAVPAKRRQRA